MLRNSLDQHGHRPTERLTRNYRPSRMMARRQPRRRGSFSGLLRYYLTVLATAGLLLFLMSQVTKAQSLGLAPGQTPMDLPHPEGDIPVDSAKGYGRSQLAGPAHLVGDGIYQSMFCVGHEGVIVFDAPPSLDEKIIAAVREVTDLPITYFVYSHSHADHVAGVGFLRDVTRIGSEPTAEKLVRFGDPARPVPEITFKDTYSFADGNCAVSLSTAIDGHERGASLIHLPNQKILMAVDMVYPGWAPFTNLAMAEDVGLFIEDHDILLSYDFDIYVGGHVGRAGTLADVQAQRDFLKDLVTFAGDALQSTDFAAIAAETGYQNRWLMVNSYLDAVAADCYDRIIEKWAHG